MDITCENQIKMTGRVTSVEDKFYGEHRYIMLTLKNVTRFQKINGAFETQTNLHTCMLWQRHNKNSLDLINSGDIISVTGELKNQSVTNGYTWSRRIMVFVYDFAVLGHADDKLLCEETKAKTYDE